jgi:[ribosomal protein S5]-alanine N-acetyltransferase
MQSNYITERLVLNKLSIEDNHFIYELVNTPEWIKFIGQRNIKTTDDAKNYIEKIINNPQINYWVVKLKTDNSSIGIITFIKRDYLEHHDIGFAFLKKYTQMGYAFEASKVVLTNAISNKNHQQILATIIKENVHSIKLLEKLGLSFYKEIEYGEDLLMVYAKGCT